MKAKSRTEYNMYEAKTNLSEIVARAREGMEVILMNRGEPVARVVPFRKANKVRRLGFAKGIKMLKGFNEIPKDFDEYV